MRITYRDFAVKYLVTNDLRWNGVLGSVVASVSHEYYPGVQLWFEYRYG